MSFLRIILLGTYLAGCATLILSIVIRLGVAVGDFSSRGAVGFAAACFLCALATREVAATLDRSKEQAQVPTPARSAVA